MTNCSTTTNSVTLSSAPAVAVAPVTSGAAAATVSPPVAANFAGSPCTGKGADAVTFTFTNTHPSGGSAQVVTLSALRFDVGSTTAAPSKVVATLAYADAGAGSFTPLGSPVTVVDISAVTASAGSPPALFPNTADQPLGPITITENEPAQIPGGDAVCLRLTGPGHPGDAATGPNFTPGVVPALAVTGSAAAGSVALGGPSAAHPVELSFIVSAASTTVPSTFTLTGAALDTYASTGPVTTGVGFAPLDTTPGHDPAGPACAANNLASATTSASTVPLAQLGGADRYATAAAAFQATFGCPAGASAVLARGDAFPDALAASYLAGFLHTGILLTDPSNVPAVTLEQLASSGISTVYVVGGPSAVRPSAISELEHAAVTSCGGSPSGQTLTVHQIGGVDRYETDRMVVETPGATPGSLSLPQTGVFDPATASGAATPSSGATAILASGTNFPDAVAAGALAYAGPRAVAVGGGVSPAGFQSNGDGLPLVLTGPGALSAPAATALGDLHVTNVLVMGGTAALSSTVTDALQARGIRVLRFAGINRDDTAAQLATFETRTYGDLPGTPTSACGVSTCTTIAGLFWNSSGSPAAVLARGDDFADALAAGPVAGSGMHPLLLTTDPSTLGNEAYAFLVAHNPAHLPAGGADGPGGISSLVVVGGPAAVGPAVVSAAVSALGS